MSKEREAANAETAEAFADIIARCEDVYVAASRQGYVDNPKVAAAVVALKAAHAVLAAAEAKRYAAVEANAFLRATAASWRANRAADIAEAAYKNLLIAVLQAGEENFARTGDDSVLASDIRAFSRAVGFNPAA